MASIMMWVGEVENNSHRRGIIFVVEIGNANGQSMVLEVDVRLFVRKCWWPRLGGSFEFEMMWYCDDRDRELSGDDRMMNEV